MKTRNSGESENVFISYKPIVCYVSGVATGKNLIGPQQHLTKDKLIRKFITGDENGLEKNWKSYIIEVLG